MTSWAHFKEQLLLRFLPAKEEDRRAQFFNLQQDGTVREYRRKFEQLSRPLKDLSEATLESKFVSGLKEEIQMEMRMFGLVGLKPKMRMAQLIEDMGKPVSLSGAAEVQIWGAKEAGQTRLNRNRQPRPPPARVQRQLEQ